MKQTKCPGADRQNFGIGGKRPLRRDSFMRKCGHQRGGQNTTWRQMIAFKSASPEWPGNLTSHSHLMFAPRSIMAWTGRPKRMSTFGGRGRCDCLWLQISKFKRRTERSSDG